MQGLSLDQIARLSKHEPARAGELTLTFLRECFPELELQSIRIIRSKLSLNSLNGIVEGVGARYFFKMHTEEGEAETLTDSEYYRAQELADAGYPVILPLHVRNKPGRQAVLYPWIDSPTAFDWLEAADGLNARASDGVDSCAGRWEKYLAAEQALVSAQRRILLSSLKLSTAAELQRSPLFQLFWNRLVPVNGCSPRLHRFYERKIVPLPNRGEISWEKLRELKWQINGRPYPESLREILVSACSCLAPSNEALFATVVGHGDDHNGNKFLSDDRLVLFDPAFAGRQPALLSFIKATAHNVFLHPRWFYDPQSVEVDLRLEIQGDQVVIEHNYQLEVVAPYRLQLLELYLRELWRPLIQELDARGWLASDWEVVVKRGLSCCVLLTQNLLGHPDKGGSKFTPELVWLAFARAVELGAGDVSNWYRGSD